MNKNPCTNCSSLSEQCIQLKEEISVLTQKLDNLLKVVLCEKKDFCCQVNPFLVSSSTQTDNVTITTPPVVSHDKPLSPLFPDIFCDTSLSSTYQDSVLLDIFLSTESTNDQVSSVTHHEKAYATPFVVLPFVSLPNLPFANFDLTKLDQETDFDTILNTRSLSFLGDFSYSYNGVKHNPKPIPTSDKYLCTMLEHVNKLMPDYKYNSILITKYRNGTDSLGFHSDNESEIVDGSDIVTISLGETRTVKFRSLTGSGNTCPEQSLNLDHGNVFVMSRVSQNYFQHSIIPDGSQNPRISLTLRLLKPETIINSPSNFEVSPLNGVINNFQSPLTFNNNASPVSEKITLYIGDSMFRHFSSSKLSSTSQKAVVLSYPGATVGGVLSKLKNDPEFSNIDPHKVRKIYLFCGTNNIDKALGIPFSHNSNFVDSGYRASDSAVNSIKSEFEELTHFLHSWANEALINIVNILPRVSAIRNNMINIINQYIYQLSSESSFVEMVSTERHRSLFSFENGFRKRDFFSNNGEDNVHLNNNGIVRLAKYLKYFAHHQF